MSPWRSAFSQSLMTRRDATSAGPVDSSGTPGGSARSLAGGVVSAGLVTVRGGVCGSFAPPHPAAAVTERAASRAAAERPTAMG